MDLFPLLVGLLVAIVTFWLVDSQGWAAGLLAQLQAQQIPQVTRLKAGQYRLFRPPFDLTRISVANPEVVDIALISEPTRKKGKEQVLIYIVGLGTGVTNLSLWGRGRFITATVKVEPDLSLLKEKLAQVLPKEKIAVESAGDSLVLMGKVSGPLAQQTAVALAQAFLREQSLSSQPTAPPPAGQGGALPGSPGAGQVAAQAPAPGGVGSGGQKAFNETKVINLLHQEKKPRPSAPPAAEILPPGFGR
jgi:Flp pilus assembly secretin CpaC